MEINMSSITTRIIAQVVEKEDEYLKSVITTYAMERAKELEQEIRVLFIDKAIADEIIDLGVKVYLSKLPKPPSPQA